MGYPNRNQPADEGKKKQGNFAQIQEKQNNYIAQKYATPSYSKPAFEGQHVPDIHVPEIMPFPSVANPVYRNVPLYAGSPFQPFLSFDQGGFYNGLIPEMFANPYLGSQVSALANFYQNRGNFHAPTILS